MRIARFMVFAAAALFVGWVYGSPREFAAAAGPALAGEVTSQEEGKMEGVVVSAHREGGNYAVSVVSDSKGKYSFPVDHLAAGTYKISTRAVGYDVVDPGTVTVASGKATTTNLKLEKTKNLPAQMSSAEWMMSVNGTQEEKDRFVYQIMSCNYCHSLNRVFMSKHTPETLMKAMDRMVHYYADGTAKSNDNRRGRAALVQEPGREKALEQNPEWGSFPGIPRTEIAAFVAKNNLSEGRTAYPYELKTSPRPTGKATRVIITEYDMPTASTVSHDSDIDSKGVLWYTDESAQLLGKFEPKTATFTEIRDVLPVIPKGNMEGTRDVVIDKDDKVWFPVRTPGNHAMLSRYDPVTGKLDIVENVGGQFVALGGDGYVWAGNTRVNPKTLKVEGQFSYQGAPALPPGPNGGYQTLVDSKGNPWIATYRGPGGMINVNITNKEVKFLPIPGLRGRRGRIDFKDDTFYFGEYLADKVSYFDIPAGQIHRLDVPKYSTPYTASIADKKGRFYSPSNGFERLYQVDPKTGEIVAFQMPTEFDTKKLAIDPTTANTTVWFTNKRTARVVKVEPLD